MEQDEIPGVTWRHGGVTVVGPGSVVTENGTVQVDGGWTKKILDIENLTEGTNYRRTTGILFQV